MAQTLETHGKRVGIFVIAFNAERHVVKTLVRIPPHIWNAVEEVYLIDDCSTDETVDEAMRWDRHGGKFVVLRNPVNRRYGGNQKLGYQHAVDRKLDIVVMLHADGQYAPECMELMLAPLLTDEAIYVCRNPNTGVGL